MIIVLYTITFPFFNGLHTFGGVNVAYPSRIKLRTFFTLNSIWVYDTCSIIVLLQHYLYRDLYYTIFFSILQQWRPQADGRKHYLSGTSGAVLQ